MKDENVICVETSAIESAFDLSKQYWRVKIEVIDALRYEYVKRAVAEVDFNYKQVIPYAIVENRKGEVLCYQRCGSEKRLSDMFSVGIGGHVNDKDVGHSLYECLLSGLMREFSEEVGVNIHECQIELMGMINEDVTEVGHCHIGVVFKIVVDDSYLRFDSEIGNPQWVTMSNIDLSRFELWSNLALKLNE